MSLGEGEHRTWGDCRKYGFISGGQGKWYSQTLKLLFPGSRVYVNIPKTGYVGVGTVKERTIIGLMLCAAFFCAACGNQQSSNTGTTKAEKTETNNEDTIFPKKEKAPSETFSPTKPITAGQLDFIN